jgi:predicted DNA-binding transcriptional regulator AlpA
MTRTGERSAPAVDRLMTPDEVADYLQRPVTMLAQWRWRNVGPRYLKLAGGHVRYRRADVEAWLDAQTRGGPDAAAV